MSQKRCILHDDILGLSSPSLLNGYSYVNAYTTESLQLSSDYYHYERLGRGNSTIYQFTNLTLQHRRTFYVNIKLTNVLGYANSITSQLVTVDLTPPTPGLINNPISDTLINERCGFNEEQVCIGPTTSVDNHRYIYMSLYGIYMY